MGGWCGVNSHGVTYNIEFCRVIYLCRRARWQWEYVWASFRKEEGGGNEKGPGKKDDEL